jgi:hypothetical protein
VTFPFYTPGELHHNAKLTNVDVLEIRRLAKLRRELTDKHLARKFGVGLWQIRKIVAGTSWKHLK